MSNRGKVRQYAIAEQLGLSRSTVSKVFANGHDVSQETRNRVMAAAEQMGYKPRVRAGESKPNTELMVGMLVRIGPEAPTNYQPDYLQGVSEAATAHDVSLLVHCVRSDTSDPDFFRDPSLQPAALKHGRLDGLLLSGGWSEEGMRLASEGLPTVAITFGTQQNTIDVVEPDTLGAMRALVYELVGQGHRRLAFCGLSAAAYWSVERYAGFVAALATVGLDATKMPVLRVSDAALWGDERAAEWGEHTRALRALIADDGVTAVVCCSDWAAFNLHLGLTQLGLAIPQDVSLAGFDDHEFSTLGRPPVTSVHVPRSQLAALALERLIERCKAPQTPTRRSLFRCSLVDNGTTAPPASR